VPGQRSGEQCSAAHCRAKAFHSQGLANLSSWPGTRHGEWLAGGWGAAPIRGRPCAAGLPTTNPAGCACRNQLCLPSKPLRSTCPAPLTCRLPIRTAPALPHSRAVSQSELHLPCPTHMPSPTGNSTLAVAVPPAAHAPASNQHSAKHSPQVAAEAPAHTFQQPGLFRHGGCVACLHNQAGFETKSRSRWRRLAPTCLCVYVWGWYTGREALGPRVTIAAASPATRPCTDALQAMVCKGPTMQPTSPHARGQRRKNG
jgi:hypothetical protein